MAYSATPKAFWSLNLAQLSIRVPTLHMPPLGRPRSPLSPLKARGHRLAPTRQRSRGNATTASAQGTKLATATRSALRSSRKPSNNTLLMLQLPLRSLPLLFPLESPLEALMLQVPAPLPPCTALTPSGTQTRGLRLI